MHSFYQAEIDLDSIGCKSSMCRGIKNLDFFKFAKRENASEHCLGSCGQNPTFLAYAYG